MISYIKHKETGKKYLVLVQGVVFNTNTKVSIFKEIDVEDALPQVLSEDKIKAQFDKIQLE